MMTSSSPAPIVLMNMMSNAAARSTGWFQRVRTPASMPPPWSPGFGGVAAGWSASSGAAPGANFIRTALASAARKDTAVKRKGTACASARIA